MKKILILGGSYFQMPAIVYAKSQGYYVITCDYLPSNPGHELSDAYYNVSTTDKEAVLALAKELNIDGILCFASDPAAPTAAYVSEGMGLPGNTYENICRFGEKHLWRKFLKENGFNVPKAQSYASYDQIIPDEWDYPVMIKPVDSSGSKGVTKVENKADLLLAFEHALAFSRKKIVLVEEFIYRVGAQIGGDGFYGDDKLDFVCYGDQIVDNKLNGIVPCGMVFPSVVNSSLLQKITKEIERAITLSGLRNISFNLEVMVDKAENVYLMELGPRNGGNFIPNVIDYYANVNMTALAVEAAMGKKMEIFPRHNNGFYAYYALHSYCAGIYKGYRISEKFRGEVLEQHLFLTPGSRVDTFTGSNQTIGIILLKFEQRSDLDSFFEAPMTWIRVRVEECENEMI